MTDTKAIENLNKLISDVSGIQRNSSEHTRWLSNVLRVLDEKLGADSHTVPLYEPFLGKRQDQEFIADMIFKHKGNATIKMLSGAKWSRQKELSNLLLTL